MKIKSIIATLIAGLLFIILTEDSFDQMNTLKRAFVIFAAFIALCTFIYCFVLAFFSFISGWRVLSLKFPAPETVQSDSALFYSQSVEMGYMTYAMSVDIRFIDAGLIFSQSRFFTFMHKPFIILYEKIEHFKKINSSDSDLEFTFEGIKMKMSGESAEALIKKKLNPSVPIVSLKSGEDDPDRSMKKGEQKFITRKCRFEELQYGFISEVRDFIKHKKIDGLQDTMLYCCETTYMKKGFFPGIVYHQYTDLVLTEEWFFWGVCDGDGCSSGCAKIMDIAKTHNPEKILTSNSLEIRGINITGFHSDESDLTSWRINVGNDEESTSFRNKLAELVNKYRK